MAMPEKFYRVAVLCSSSFVAQQVTRAFTQELSSIMSNALVLTYSAWRGGPEVYEHFAQEICDSNFDLIITLGVFPTEAMVEVLLRNKSNIPLIYLYSTDTVLEDYIKDNVEKSIGVSLTLQSGFDAITALHKCKPTIRSVLFVYDHDLSSAKRSSNDWFEKYIADVKGYCYNNRVSVDFYRNTNQHYPYKMKELISDYDAVVAMEGYIRSDIQLFLGTLCSEKGKTCMVSSIELVKYGASALGFAPEYSKIGTEAAKVVNKILLESRENKYHERITLSDARILCMNYDKARPQGLDPEHVLFVINEYRGKVF